MRNEKLIKVHNFSRAQSASTLHLTIYRNFTKTVNRQNYKITFPTVDLMDQSFIVSLYLKFDGFQVLQIRLKKLL